MNPGAPIVLPKFALKLLTSCFVCGAKTKSGILCLMCDRLRMLAIEDVCGFEQCVEEKKPS
jgi:hypothetical protein